MRKNKVAKNVKEFLLDLIFMTAGSVIYAVGLNGFTAPNNIAPGGVSGIAIVLNYLFGTPVGTVILLINVPIIIWAIIEIGYKLVTKTMLAVVLNAACIDIVALFMPVYHGDPLIITLIGGVCEGVGLSLVFMRGATTGGTDMIARPGRGCRSSGTPRRACRRPRRSESHRRSRTSGNNRSWC